MTRNLNELTFIGNVGSQPELRHTQTSNKAVTDFFLAITENWKNQAGEIESETTWVKVVCWDNTAESVAKVINKGDLVFIRGKLRIKTIEKDIFLECKRLRKVTLRYKSYEDLVMLIRSNNEFFSSICLIYHLWEL